MPEEQDTRYDVFISYYQKSGINFARHLKKGLKDVGIIAFLDESDIPKTIKYETDEWRTIIDNAILNCDKFILLMTFNFNTRKEVLRELKLAIDNNIDRIFCMHRNLRSEDLIVKMDEVEYDLSKREYIRFDDEPDLLRELGAELLGRGSKRKRGSLFFQNSNNLIQEDGHEIRSGIGPKIEIILGPTDEPTEWLETNSENRILVSISPYYFKDINARRKWYEFIIVENIFYKIYTNGFFHLIIPLPVDKERGVAPIDVVVFNIIKLLVTCIIIMKFKKVTDNQSIRIILRDIKYVQMWLSPKIGSRGFPFPFFDLLGRSIFEFSKKSNDVEFSFSFSPNISWSDIKRVFFEIYFELCKELGFIDITETEIYNRIYFMLKHMDIVNTSHRLHSGIVIPKIDLDEFDFTEEEKK